MGTRTRYDGRLIDAIHGEWREGVVDYSTGRRVTVNITATLGVTGDVYSGAFDAEAVAGDKAMFLRGNWWVGRGGVVQISAQAFDSPLSWELPGQARDTGRQTRRPRH